MNSKNIILTAIFFILIGCGVKSDPVPPPGTQLPSYVDKFLEEPQAEEEDKKDKDKERP